MKITVAVPKLVNYLLGAPLSQLLDLVGNDKRTSLLCFGIDYGRLSFIVSASTEKE